MPRCKMGWRDKICHNSTSNQFEVCEIPINILDKTYFSKNFNGEENIEPLHNNFDNLVDWLDDILVEVFCQAKAPLPEAIKIYRLYPSTTAHRSYKIPYCSYCKLDQIGWQT